MTTNSRYHQQLGPHRTDTPSRVPNTTLQQTSSPDITLLSNTLYNWTSWTTQHVLSSDHLHIIPTINIRHDYRQQTATKPTNTHKLQKKRLDALYQETEFAFAQTTIPINIHTVNRIYTTIIVMADKHNIPKGKMHSNCKNIYDHIVCKIIHRNNMRRANTCDPALKRLNTEITSDIHTKKYGRNIYMHNGIIGETQVQPNGSPAGTITVALHISKAFDTINIHTLIRKLLHTNIPCTIIKFIANYTYPYNVNFKLAFHKATSSLPHY